MSFEHLLAKKSSAKELKKSQPKVVVNQKSISCPDILKQKEHAHHYQQKHPRVMLELNENDSKGRACYYCGTIYVYEADS